MDTMRPKWGKSSEAIVDRPSMNKRSGITVVAPALLLLLWLLLLPPSFMLLSLLIADAAIVSEGSTSKPLRRPLQGAATEARREVQGVGPTSSETISVTGTRASG